MVNIIFLQTGDISIVRTWDNNPFYSVADDDIQLEELDGLKADLLSLQASVHKSVGCQH